MSLRRAAEICLTNQRLLESGNAFIRRTGDEAHLLRLAEEADARWSSGQPKSPLDGMMIGIKDNICTKGTPTTCASRMLKDYLSPFDATVIQKLHNAGALVVGKTNLDEFGMGSYSINSYFGPVRNTHGVQGASERSAGGSSGGSAVAVATGQCFVALGTDTGGSVRLPAAYTGIVGFKPSFGMVSRWGVVAYANSMDTIGVLARDTKSTRMVFDVINGFDQKDPTSLSTASRSRIMDQVKDRKRKVKMRIGVPMEYNVRELHPVVRQGWRRTIRHFQDQGHEVYPVALPTTRHALSAYYILAPSEASSNLARYDGVRYGSREEGPDDAAGGVLYARTRGKNFGPEVKRRILLGTYSLSAEAMDNYFIQAQKIRRMVQQDFDSVFDLPNPLQGTAASVGERTDSDEVLDEQQVDHVRVDVLVCPTAPSLPPTLDELKTQDPLDSYVNDVFTVPASLAGLPAVSVPVPIDNVGDDTDYPKDVIWEEALSGVSSVGMQIIGQYGDDERVLEVAAMIESWNSSEGEKASS